MTFIVRPSELYQTYDQEDLILWITNQIRRSLELRDILAATVTEVRSFLGTDRVMVYRFNVDQSGEVVAESIHEQRLPSLLGLNFPTDDIPLHARQMFVSVGQRSIVDVANCKIGLSPLYSIDTNQPSQTDNNIKYRQVDPCHLQYLTAMGVQSSLVVPILHSDLKEQSAQPQLWGLLVSHHSQPRTILPRELKVLQQVADQVAIAIAQSNLLSESRAQQQREAVINQVTTLLHKFPTIQLQEALETTIAAFGGIGGRLYIQQSTELYTWGEQPILPYDLENSIIEQHSIWQNWISQCNPGNIWAISDLYKESSLRVLASAYKFTKIRGILIIPLHYRQNFIGLISIFRPEVDTEILWAGRCDQNQRQSLPQLSFEVWREKKKGQAAEWKPEEISLGQAFCYHFSMAIQQQQMYQRVQTFNANLENLVLKKTANLEKSLQLTKAIKQVTEQIRSTLDYNIILQTIVSEVRSLINSNRVIIYQMEDECDGKIVVEQIDGNWQSILGLKLSIKCLPYEYASLYFQGRVRTIHDVSKDVLSSCHREFLQSLEVQANLIVPIKMGMRLWGLLIAHQCDAPRIWDDEEINLLQQLADQAGIAIQQAQLYEKTYIAETQATAKAQQLEHTLRELQETQAKLIQTEKMSSLGQLVAGVAHEINNPVNFIHGNLHYTSNYTQELLKLLRLYQFYYPNPNNEICVVQKKIDLDFIAQDLPKIISSMQVGAERIRSIVLSLRNFSRLDEAEYKSVDVHEGIDNTLLILQHRLKSNGNFPGIEIIKDYSNLPLIECYAAEMNQVFMNILNNAIDVLEMGTGNSSLIPTIGISTRVSADNTYVLIRIRDNGSGITEDVKKRIFDPFFTTKPVGQGIGMGLAISYQIVVKKHGGVLECVSEPGKGTEFWIEIPIKPLSKINQTATPNAKTNISSNTEN